MLRTLFVVSLALSAHVAHAFDATDSMTEVTNIGKWQVAEFAARENLIYRISSDALNAPDQNIVFDVSPQLSCRPTPAVIIWKLGSYVESLDDGMVVMAYKLPKQQEHIEVTKTAMGEDGQFAFFAFEQLTAEYLLGAKDIGKLATWIPASGDGVIQRSANVYFSLEGFSRAHEMAMRACRENN